MLHTRTPGYFCGHLGDSSPRKDCAAAGAAARPLLGLPCPTRAAHAPVFAAAAQLTTAAGACKQLLFTRTGLRGTLTARGRVYGHLTPGQLRSPHSSFLLSGRLAGGSPPPTDFEAAPRLRGGSLAACLHPPLVASAAHVAPRHKKTMQPPWGTVPHVRERNGSIWGQCWCLAAGCR